MLLRVIAEEVQRLAVYKSRAGAKLLSAGKLLIAASDEPCFLMPLNDTDLLGLIKGTQRRRVRYGFADCACTLIVTSAAKKTRFLGPFHGAIAVTSVTRCRCCRRRRRGHPCAGGVRQWRRATVATPGEWRCKIRACGGSQW